MSSFAASLGVSATTSSAAVTAAGSPSSAGSSSNTTGPSFDNLIDNAMDSNSDGSGHALSDQSRHDAASDKKTTSKADKSSAATTDPSANDPDNTLLNIAFSAQVLLAAQPAPAIDNTTPDPTSDNDSSSTTDTTDGSGTPTQTTGNNSVPSLPNMSAPNSPSSQTNDLIPVQAPVANPVASATALPDANTTAAALATAPALTATQNQTQPEPQTQTLTSTLTSSSIPTSQVNGTGTRPTSTARKLVSTANADLTQTDDLSASQPVVDAIADESVKAEKNTSKDSSTSTKIPVPAATSAASQLKNFALPTISLPLSNSQVPQDMMVNLSATSVANNSMPSIESAKSATGTDRAGMNAMQTLNDLWPQAAFRAFASGTDSSQSSSSANTPSETVSLSSNAQFAAAVQKALNTPNALYPRRVEIELHTPPGEIVTLSLTRSNGELRAQLGASSEQGLQWLNGEANDLGKMNFGVSVKWSPPQLSNQQKDEQQPHEHQGQRGRDGQHQRNQQNSMDAITEEFSSLTGELSSR